MTTVTRRRALRFFGVSVALAAAMTTLPSAAQDRTSVKIGYAISKTGPNSGGAGITTLPNYQLWVKDVNDSGGLELPDGKKLPIEVIEYDAGQGRLHPAAMGNRLQPRRRAAVRPLRLPAARRLGGDRQGAGIRQALEEELLAARRRPRLHRSARGSSVQGGE